MSETDAKLRGARNIFAVCSFRRSSFSPETRPKMKETLGLEGYLKAEVTVTQQPCLSVIQ